MSLDPLTIIRRWFDEVWNRGLESTVDELLATDAISHGLGEGLDAHSRADFKVFWRNMRSAFPDIHITIEDAIAQADRAATRLLLQGTNLGDGLGMPPTGRSISVSAIVMIRVAGGQIVEGWNSWDQLGLLRQLGAVPEQKPPDRFLHTSA